jgi:hypothetical protein
LALQTKGSGLVAMLNGKVICECADTDRPLMSGSVAMVCEEGRVDFGYVRIQPL